MSDGKKGGRGIIRLDRIIRMRGTEIAKGVMDGTIETTGRGRGTDQTLGQSARGDDETIRRDDIRRRIDRFEGRETIRLGNERTAREEVTTTEMTVDDLRFHEKIMAVEMVIEITIVGCRPLETTQMAMAISMVDRMDITMGMQMGTRVATTPDMFSLTPPDQAHPIWPNVPSLDLLHSPTVHRWTNNERLDSPRCPGMQSTMILNEQKLSLHWKRRGDWRTRWKRGTGPKRDPRRMLVLRSINNKAR